MSLAEDHVPTIRSLWQTFFDLFYIGEGETSYDALLDLYKEWKKGDASREAFLHQAAKIPGIYVPSLYEVSYQEDGTLASMEPVYDDIPEKNRKTGGNGTDCQRLIRTNRSYRF